MKIEKIIIENINSIEKAEISFSEGILANEPLFLITGETGSGKSTILDAITLSLYDKSPRYENTRNKEKTENGLSTMQSTTNALRKGTSDGKAEVWFSVGNEIYIATWQMHRTRNGKYDMTNRRKLEVVKGTDRIVLETKIDTVNQRITELVGLTYDQFVRSVMLAQGQFNTFLTSEKAKQTEILEMLTGTEVYSKIAEIVGRRKNDAKNDVDKALEIYNSLTKNILSDEELASLNEELSNNEKLQADNENEIKTVEAQIRNFEMIESLDREIDFSKSQLADLQASLEKILEDKNVLSKKRDELKIQIDDQSGMQSLKEKMPLIMSLLQGGNSVTTIDDGKSDISELSIMLTEAENAKNDATAAYDECNEKLEKADVEGLRNQYNEHNNELTKLGNWRTKCLGVKQILTNYLNKKQIIDNKLVELDKLKQNFNICEIDFQNTKTTFEDKDSEYQIQKNMVADFMKSLRAKLEEGKPCPLCGSTSHQYHDEKVVDSLFATIETAWNEARNAFEKAKDAKNKAEGEINLLNKSIGNEKKLLENLVKNLTAECNGKPVYEIERLDKGLNDCESMISVEKNKLEEINKQIAAARDIQEELKGLQKLKNDAENNYNSLLKRLAYRWKHLNDEYSKVDSDINKIDEIANGIKQIEGYERIVEFEGKVATRNNIDKGSILIGFTKVLTNLIGKSGERKKIVDALENDAVTKVEYQDKLTHLNVVKQSINVKLSDIRTKLSLNTQNSASAQAAKDDLQAKTVKLSLWTQLANAIGTTAGDNFRDVAQAYTMRILLDQANYFLRKLSQRYELTCYSNSLAIMVMDKEMGGEMRSASSLSGGETFLVSLALALGLASLNDENLSIDMLFIDEGFGTLDGESLEMAVQALGNMQKFGRKVGIISHVDSLKERIPAQIQVTRRGKAASTVELFLR
ncbi:MAG: SMC family ATPase [Bacteroidales bacterium]|nr:SMC family ATPase [Bacteroidales bacterium]